MSEKNTKDWFLYINAVILYINRICFIHLYGGRTSSDTTRAKYAMAGRSGAHWTRVFKYNPSVKTTIAKTERGVVEKLKELSSEFGDNVTCANKISPSTDSATYIFNNAGEITPDSDSLENSLNLYDFIKHYLSINNTKSYFFPKTSYCVKELPPIHAKPLKSSVIKTDSFKEFALLDAKPLKSSVIKIDYQSSF